MMKNSINAGVLAILLSFGSAFAQSKATSVESKAVVVPQDVYLSVIVAQPDCSLRIEKAYLLRYLDGGFGSFYRLRNLGAKPIRSYTVAMWGSDNAGDVITWYANKTEELLKQSQSFPSDDPDIAIIPLSRELRDKLDLKPPLKRVIFYMIVEIEFADSTRYNAQPLFNALKKHLSMFESTYEKKMP